MNEGPVSTDTILQILGLKEVELNLLKQQIQSLIRENAELKSKSSKDTHDDSR